MISKPTLGVFFVISIGLTLAEILNTTLGKTDMYDHIVFSTFLRLDAVMHFFLYIAVVVDYYTYNWYVGNWKR